MPPIETQHLRDYAVLWMAEDYNEYGRYNVASPIEIRVRWEGGKQQSDNPTDEVDSWPTTIYVDREIEIGSVLWHGKLRNLPSPPTNLFKVNGRNTIPDLRNRHYQRTVSLVRHGNTLPTVV